MVRGCVVLALAVWSASRYEQPMRLRPVLSLLLAMMLALTGQSMAMARGAAAATGQIVICSGAGPIAVYTDAQGQPTTAPYICPDAALAAVASPVVTPVTVAGPIVPCVNARMNGLAKTPRIALHIPQPRAPPCSI